jgi:hypothetical protein
MYGQTQSALFQMDDTNNWYNDVGFKRHHFEGYALKLDCTENRLQVELFAPDDDPTITTGEEALNVWASLSPYCFSDSRSDSAGSFKFSKTQLLGGNANSHYVLYAQHWHPWGYVEVKVDGHQPGNGD